MRALTDTPEQGVSEGVRHLGTKRVGGLGRMGHDSGHGVKVEKTPWHNNELSFKLS